MAHQANRTGADAALDDEQAEALLAGKFTKWSQEEQRVGRWTWTAATTTPWLLSAFLLALLMLDHTVWAPEACAPAAAWRPFEFPYEVSAARDMSAALKPTRFTGGITVTDKHQLARIVDADAGPAYVGTPTAEMDRAWETLMRPLEIFLTQQEARRIGEEMSVDKESGLYMAEITATHDLHCLNMLRQAVYPDHYPKMKNGSHMQTHLDHCINALRQSITCNADMTLIHTRSSPVRNGLDGKDLLPNFQSRHMCRDYEALQRSLTTRDANSDGWRMNAARLLAEDA